MNHSLLRASSPLSSIFTRDNIKVYALLFPTLIHYNKQLALM